MYLAVDNIKRALKNSLRPDRETVPSLPKNVPETYERILDRVPSDQKIEVETILRIIVGARRPLTVQEMAMALGVATTPGAERAIEAGLSPKGLDRKIRQLCGLFVFIKDSKIYLIHETAREFLIGNHDISANVHWHLEQRKTEVLMTDICVRYLPINDLVCNDEQSARSLLDYSAENCADYFRDVPSPETELVSGSPRMKALHLAAFNGHPSIVCRVEVNTIGVIDRADNSGTTALQWACERKNLENVQLLLANGADVNALQAAADEGHVEIVQLLLRNVVAHVS